MAATAVKQLTLYSAKICPFAHRVELALNEAKAEFSRFEIDLQNKPEWYAPKINPASKVPAVAYGGPKVSPDQPSPESDKIAESLVLLEFVADLYPKSGLLPADPVERARIRFFIDTFSNKFFGPYHATFTSGGSFDGALLGIEALQEQLSKDGKYLIGDQFTIADAAVAPFLGRLEVALSNDIGKYDVGEGKKTWELITTSPKYSRFWKYYQDLKARESFKATFDAPYIKEFYSKRWARDGSEKQ